MLQSYLHASAMQASAYTTTVGRAVCHHYVLTNGFRAWNEDSYRTQSFHGRPKLANVEHRRIVLLVFRNTGVRHVGAV